MQTLKQRPNAALVVGVLAVVLALLGLVLGVNLSRTYTAVVATTYIPQGARITADMVREIEVPIAAPPELNGIAATAFISGTYAVNPILDGQLIAPPMVQVMPPEDVAYQTPDHAPEFLERTLFELSLEGISEVTPANTLNVLALVEGETGADAAFSVGAMDRAGSGARAVRVLRDLDVKKVVPDADVVMVEVTVTQSHYLWSLVSAQVPIVGEITREQGAPLGVLRPQDMTTALIDTADDGGVPPALPVPIDAPTAVVPDQSDTDQSDTDQSDTDQSDTDQSDTDQPDTDQPDTDQAEPTSESQQGRQPDAATP